MGSYTEVRVSFYEPVNFRDFVLVGTEFQHQGAIEENTPGIGDRDSVAHSLGEVEDDLQFPEGG